jgi:hypothetical protein
MSGLYALLRDHADAVEADLARYYHVDYRDRWAAERPLTLRRIAVLLRYLPAGAATYDVLDIAVWARTDHLLDDVRRTLRGMMGEKDPKPYPGRFAAAGSMPVSPERQRRLNAARRRARERRRLIADGTIT